MSILLLDGRVSDLVSVVSSSFRRDAHLVANVPFVSAQIAPVEVEK